VPKLRGITCRAYEHDPFGPEKRLERHDTTIGAGRPRLQYLVFIRARR
jgi:hypothetical protein